MRAANVRLGTMLGLLALTFFVAFIVVIAR